MSSSCTRPHRSRFQLLAAILALGITATACGTAAAVPTPGVARSPSLEEASGPTDRATADGVGAVPVQGVSAGVASGASAGSSVPAPGAGPSRSAPPAAPTTPTTTTTTAPPGPPAEQPATTEPATTTTTTLAPGWQAFDQDLLRLLADGLSSAVAATLLVDGEVVHETALGVRTSSGDPVEVGDRFRIASISKVMTAIVMLQLVEDGSIELDATVGDRLATRLGVATPANGVSEITVRDLLSHRSGIAQYENLMFARQVESCAEAGAVALGRALQRAPGTTFNYSNVNFCLLGELIEEITGRDYADVVTERLLDPLGITGMRLAGTYDVGEGDVEHDTVEDRNYMEVLDGAGSWIGSATDVATIIDSLDLTTPGWKPLGEALNEEMKTITSDPPIPPDPDAAPPIASTVAPPPPTTGYGLGLMILGPGSYGHTGTLESTHAMTVRQADGLTWAITVSGDNPWSSRDLARVVGEALTAGGFG